MNEAGSSFRARSARLAALFSVVAALTLSAPTVASAAPEGEVMVALPLLRQHFDPTGMVGTTDFLTYDMLFDGLINLTAKGKEPALAESWEISEDGKQIDFKLREGVTFHNGDPFTAEDVKFTFERLLAPDNTHSYRQAFVESLDHVEVVGPHHARFILKKPWPTFFTSARHALVGIVPKDYYQKVGPKGFQEKPIGTGPFKLADLKAGEWTRFEANPDYWGTGPQVKAVTERLVQEPFTRYAMLERGEADIIMGLTGPLLERIRSNPKLRVVFAKYSGTSGLMFDKGEFPESAKREVRVAIGHAINREAIAEHILGGVCEPATSLFTPATFGHLPGLSLISYDPDKARAMLREAGVPEGYEVSYLIHTQSFSALPNAPQVLEAIAGYLEAVGFKLKRVPVETGAWLSLMHGDNHPGIFYAPSSIPDDGGTLINSWMTSFSQWTGGNINVPEYDRIFNEQLQIADLKKREKLLQDFARLEDQRHEWVPLFWCNTPFAVGKRVVDWNVGFGSGYHLNLDELTLAN